MTTTRPDHSPLAPSERIVLVPLDERPVCADLPAMVAAIAGISLHTPPRELMPRLRVPGDPDAIGAWLRRSGQDADAAIVALETLGYGGLIASRTLPVPTGDVIARWAALRSLASRGVPVHAVTLVTRTSDSADAMEEPDYWNPHGPALHRLSADLHRAAAERTSPVRDTPHLPASVRADFLHRRLRNHTLNLAALELLTAGTLRSLIIGADDTAPYGLATAELDWIQDWTGWLGLGEDVAVRPGADEACTTLVARCLLRLLGVPAPRVAIEAVDLAELARVAPYENRPVAVTAARQIEACGALPVAAGGPCDLRLLIHAPDGTGADWAVAPPRHRTPAAAPRAAALAERAVRFLETGEAVAVADCAQPNGSDPLLVRELRARGVIERLAGYAAWNTAGNTLGTATAHALAVIAATRAGRLDTTAHHRLLLRRLLEDWAYATHIRPQARDTLNSDPARHEQVPADHPVIARMEEGLEELRQTLGCFPAYTLVPGSVRLPWGRTFEIDFAIAAPARRPRTEREAP